MNQGPFRYDQVGSLLRTDVLKQAKQKYQDRELSYEAYKKIEREEIKTIVDKQLALGLKAISDGEFNREYWHYDFISHIIGIEHYLADRKGDFQGVMHKLKAYYVKDRLVFPKDHPFLDDYRYLHDLVGDKAIAKFTIPGPNMIYLSGVLNSPLYHTHTNNIDIDIDIVKQDIIQVYQETIQAFYEAGCRYLQFDDTSWGVLFCEEQRKNLEIKGIDTNKLVKEFADITIECIKYKPKDMVLATHCCRGNFKSSWLYEGDYSFVQNEIFRPKFDAFFLEFDNDRSGSFEPIKHVSHGILVLGLVTTKSGILENKDIIKQRIQEASQYVPLDRLCLSCQCGFSSTEDGNDIREEEQYQKLAFVKEIAEEVWQDA